MAALLWESDARRTPAAMRMLLAVGALTAGYLIARHVPEVRSIVWFAAAAGFCAIAGLTRGNTARIALLLAVAAFGSAWFATRIHEPSPHSLRVMMADTAPAAGRDVITVEGLILAHPRTLPALRDVLNPHAPRTPRTRFDLRLEQIHSDLGPSRVRGRLAVHIGEPAEHGVLHGPAGLGRVLPGAPPAEPVELRAGDRIRITGTYIPLRAPMNPGEPDRRLWAAQEGSAGSLRLPSLQLVEHLPPAPGARSRAVAGALALRGWLTERAHALLLGPLTPDGRLQDPSRALLAALILGEQEPALREVRGGFQRLGLVHVLCISGFHLAMLAAVGMFALRVGGDIGRWEPILIALLLIIYLAVLPFQAPVWRAAMMVLGLLLADALGRRYDRLAVLMWIAAAMLIWRPMDLWSIGFQLSFGLVASLIWLSDSLHQRLWGFRLRGVVHPDPGFGGIVLEWFKRLFTANLLCWGVASPLIAFHTGLISPLAVIAGIVIVPMVMFVLIGGYAIVLLGVLAPAAGPELARIGTEWLAGITAMGIAWMDALPGSSLRVPTLSLAWTIAATLLIIYWFWRGHRRDRAAWAASLVLAIWLAVEIWPGAALPRHIALRIDALAVGDGTCMLLRSGGRSGEAMLWDCGSLTPGVGQVLVPRALRAVGAWRIPTVVITHPHIDHFNAILDVAEPLGIRTVIVGERFMERAEARRHGPEAFVLEGLRERGIELKVIAAGARLRLGSAELEFFSPPPPTSGSPWILDNDQSLAAIVRPALRDDAPRRTLLLTGDMERQALEHTMALLPNLRADIMEIPHHGSAREPALEFVWRINPAIALQSTGPSRVNDERWSSIRPGRQWYKTAQNGAAWAEIRTDGSLASGAMYVDTGR